MLALVLVLLAVWLLLAILGTLLKGLMWLTVLAILAFIATGAYGWMKRQTGAR